MGTFRKRRAVGRCVACAVLAGWCVCSAAQSAAENWTTAVAARMRFEAQPAHTRSEYARVMDGFRAIYHANPQDTHAPAAVAQVAELLAEQGHELHDAKSSTDAAGQCGFLEKGYPASSAAHSCRAKVEAVARVKLSAEVAPQVEEANASSPAASKPSSTNRNAASGSPDSLAAGSSTVARVSGIRHWSTASYTRVAIDLGDEVQYEAARVEHPDRIFFNLHHTHLAPELVGKTFSITDDGFLTKIRAAQYSDDVTRVVLDVHEVVEYSAFLLPNPYRLIIDIHGKTRNRKQEAGNDAAGGSAVAMPETSTPSVRAEKNAANQALTAPGAASNASGLPPMPVTDGSASFGLPPRSASTRTVESVSAPRVVIPITPTVAKPVPNTVTSKSTSNGPEVAAVSEQPGKVEATSRPTSAPIADRAPGSVARVAKAKTTEPTTSPEAAPPTADGATSLVRALGLKIGRIVIDAGHGGHDSGTLGAGGIQEKDVVLDVALRLGKMLHQRLGAEIVYTRADDTFIPLETRTAIANKAQADLFISIHANSSQDPSARGVEVYYLNFTSDPEAMRVAGRENAVSSQSVHELSDLVKKIALKDKIDESKELAADVDDSLFAGLAHGNEGLKNRGVKKAPFVVLIGANMPSILAEISFVTNPSDAAQLRTADYRERVAESLYTGVARYAGAINGVPASKPPRLTLQRTAAKR